MKKIITEERDHIFEDVEAQEKSIKEIYKTLEKTFAKYGIKELSKTLPTKDKIHLMCKYEYEAYNPKKALE